MNRAPFNLFHAAVEREKEEAKHHVKVIKKGQSDTAETAALIKRDVEREDE